MIRYEIHVLKLLQKLITDHPDDCLSTHVMVLNGHPELEAFPKLTEQKLLSIIMQSCNDPGTWLHLDDTLGDMLVEHTGVVSASDVIFLGQEHFCKVPKYIAKLEYILHELEMTSKLANSTMLRLWNNRIVQQCKDIHRVIHHLQLKLENFCDGLDSVDEEETPIVATAPTTQTVTVTFSTTPPVVPPTPVRQVMPTHPTVRQINPRGFQGQIMSM